MNYYIDLFSPETHKAFTDSTQGISGFRPRQEGIAKTIKPGDRFICYVTRISRFVGVLEVISDYFIDDSPIFFTSIDPFNIRFKVKPIVWLPLDKAIPIYDKLIWDHLSFTGEGRSWTAMVRSSLRAFKKEDGNYLIQVLQQQAELLKSYPMNEDDEKKLRPHKVRTHKSQDVTVFVPDDEAEIIINKATDLPLIRESIKIQGMVAEIGERMGMKIWLPRSDRSRVLELWHPKEKTLIESLPLNYDDTTLKTIENIDVLWIKGRSIIRAFEVEHSTSIYSGILRMADLMALQPNLDIKAHIVAPGERKDKVIQEITRPVFSLLEKGPLSESCTFISYESIIELSKEKRLEYMNDGVLDEYTEGDDV